MKNLKKLFISAVLLLISYASFGQIVIQDTVLAKKYYQKAIIFKDSAKYDNAIVCLVKASSLYEKNGMWREYLLSETIHGECKQKKWQLVQAASVLGDAIEKALPNINNMDTILADAYFLNGLTHIYQSSINEAENNWNNALEIRKKALGENNFKTIRTYNALGNVYGELSEFDKALSFLFKALNLKKELYGDSHIEIAKSHLNIGKIYFDLNKNSIAIKHFKEALDISEKFSNPRYISDACNNLGVIYNMKSEHSVAIYYYKKSLSTKIAHFGENNSSNIDTYTNLAGIYTQLNQFNTAKEYLAKALLLYKKNYKKENKHLHTLYLNLGRIYIHKKELDIALEYFFKALDIDKNLYGENHLNTALMYYNIAGAYMNSGDYELALKYYEKTLKVRKNLIGENNAMVAYCYTGIGSAYVNLKKHALALEYFSKSAKILNIKNPDSDDILDLNRNIGIAYVNINEYEKALNYYKKALNLSKKLFGIKHQSIANIYNNIANLYFYKKNCIRALQYYQKSTASSLKNFGDTINIYNVPEIKNYLTWNELLKSLRAKAQIFVKNYNKLCTALQHYQACDTLIMQVRNEIQTKSDKLTLGKKASEVYEEAVGVCKKLSGASKPDSASYYNQLAFNFSEKDKTRVLLDEIAEKYAMRNSGIPQKLIEKEKDLRFYTTFYKNKIENLKGDEKKEFESKLFEANREHEKLIEKFETQYPKFANLKYSTEVPKIENIQSVLNKNTAIRSYTLSDSLIYIFTITKKDFSVDTIRKAKDFNNNIKEYRRLLTNSGKNVDARFTEHSHSIYNQLFPTYVKLGDFIENLVIIPDDSLSLIPFEALICKNHKGDVNDFSTYPFLLKKYAISYAPSVTLYYDKLTGKYDAAEKNIAIFAPVFSDDKAMTINNSRGEIEQKSIYRSMEELGLLNSDKKITPLEYTKEEARQIGGIFEENYLPLMFEEANENKAKSEIMRNFKIIHFATHAVSNTHKPHLSGLHLAQDTTKGEDGFLHTNEIYGLNWNTDLVTLSACQTAEGKIQNGEGVMDLSRAFFYAGTNNVLATLWKVQDKSTADLMIFFYRNYHKKGMSFSKALQQAKLEMIMSPKNTWYPHPKFWAAFLLIGRD